jgi:signal transduction histidine kinase
MSTGQPIKPTVATLVRGRAGGHADARRILVGAAPIDEGYLLSLHSEGSFYRTNADRVSGLSHDVRAPLATIRAYTELLIDGIDEGDPDLRQLFLETIDQQAGYLTDLIVNLTDLVRLELGYLQPLKTRISLIDVAEQAIGCFQAQARQQNVPLILDSPEELPPVAADRDMLDTLFKALISNAIKFSMSRGEVVVSLRSDEEKQIITIADQGIGIADHDLPHIFDAFYRGRAAIEEDLEGIGVGLTLAKAIAEAHNGGIGVESSSRGTRDHPEAGGTRFAVWLPSEQGPEFQP